MVHRLLPLSLAVLTGCMTTSVTTPRLLPADLHVGSLDQRTDFERDRRDTDAAPAREDAPDTDKKKRRRRSLFFLGVGAAGFGVVGTTGFGIGGRVVQAQISNGYDDGSLTRDREDTLTTTGEVMNGLTIGSAAIGLAGVILAATMYGIDHARCGSLPPRREDCPDHSAPASAEQK